MQNSRIRQMSASDITAVHQIECLSITPPWTEQGFAGALANENACFYVAESLDSYEILGYCGLYFAADEGEITNVAVHPKHRREGVADQILATVLQDAVQRKLSQIFLEVRASNTAAKKLYEKHGFEFQGVRRNFYRNPKEDAIVMACFL